MIQFMTAYEPEVFQKQDVTIIYDPTTEQTFVMGGNSSPTRSNDGYKETKKRLPGGGYLSQNDAERYTDD